MPVVDDLPEVCGRVPDMNLVIDGLALLIVAVTRSGRASCRERV